MNIVKATKRYEKWLGQHLQIVDPDMRLKHEEMAKSRFCFFRATFYRWLQLWDEECAPLNKTPRLLSVGDLHVENFGTWRDTEGRLIWGVNDFDEASYYPYCLDLVRLATSAFLACRENQLTLEPKDAAAAILTGYTRSLEQGGCPFVLGEDHVWLRAIAENKLRDPVAFWKKMDALPAVRGPIPESAREALEALLPERGIPYKVAHRIAGLGSLGRVRLLAIAEWRGGRVAREAKALAPSALNFVDPTRPREILYQAIVQRAVRCPDPYVQLRGHWIVRRLSPYCSRIELAALGTGRGELRLVEAMGRETGNIHAGSGEARRVILKHLRKSKANWLLQAAAVMEEKVDRDWRVWRERRQC
ncbi:MAG: DUF2252 family protein [Terriglobales bacterium]|jgi:hypothetical protein